MIHKFKLLLLSIITVFTATSFAAPDNKANGEASPAPEEGIYKTVDESGRVIFSDHPTDKSKSEKVELKDTNTQAAPPSIPRPKPKKQATSYQIRLTSPADGARFGPAIRSAKITVKISPDFKTNFQIIYYLNGNKVAGPTRSLSTSIALGLKRRGQNTVSATLIDSSGNVVSSSNSAAFYVIRPN